MENLSSLDLSFIAPCGINCRICMAHLRDKRKCSGCNSTDVEKPPHCTTCRIKNCEVIKESKTKLCCECAKFPCLRMRQMDKRYRTSYGMSIIENLLGIKNHGMDQFLETEKIKWTCKTCSGIICVHRGYCINCKEEAGPMIHSIDEYIKDFPIEVQKMLEELRITIKNNAPDAKEKISYQMPTFYLNGNLVHFAAHMNHIGFYPAPSGIEAFKNELKSYKSAKGSVQFPLDQPLPLELIVKIIKFRVEENMKKSKK